MTAIVNMHEAKTHLSRLVERAAAGEEIIIGRAGEPRAKLVRYEPPARKRKPGAWAGKVWMADDFDDDDPELIAAFQGEDE